MNHDGKTTAVQVGLVLVFVFVLFTGLVSISLRDVSGKVHPAETTTATTPAPRVDDPDSSVPIGTPEFHGIPYEPYKNNGFNQATYEARLTANPTYTLGNFEE